MFYISKIHIKKIRIYVNVHVQKEKKNSRLSISVCMCLFILILCVAVAVSGQCQTTHRTRSIDANMSVHTNKRDDDGGHKRKSFPAN